MVKFLPFPKKVTPVLYQAELRAHTAELKIIYKTISKLLQDYLKNEIRKRIITITATTIPIIAIGLLSNGAVISLIGLGSGSLNLRWISFFTLGS
ncbi:hypothetical protein B6U80_02490 [Candidatus Pacearchaeota archaeon ex4484_26]|nr:MAG: hypothetical protein B6U80_02490 [Candidatus Pacearchaeota archaeon ex4484_26]